MNKLITIGFNEVNEDRTVVGVKQTVRQIKEAKNFKLSLTDSEGNLLNWYDIDDIRNKQTIFQTIIADRKMRVDQKQIMADRPSFCVVWIEDDEVKRIEYYEGHDNLDLVYDIRSKDLYDIEMPRSHELEENDFETENLSPFKALSVILGCDLESVYKDIHKSLIERKCNKKIKYFGRLSQTLLKHNAEFSAAMNECMNSILG